MKAAAIRDSLRPHGRVASDCNKCLHFADCGGIEPELNLFNTDCVQANCCRPWAGGERCRCAGLRQRVPEQPEVSGTAAGSRRVDVPRPPGHHPSAGRATPLRPAGLSPVRPTAEGQLADGGARHLRGRAGGQGSHGDGGAVRLTHCAARSACPSTPPSSCGALPTTALWSATGRTVVGMASLDCSHASA